MRHTGTGTRAFGAGPSAFLLLALSSAIPAMTGACSSGGLSVGSDAPLTGAPDANADAAQNDACAPGECPGIDGGTACTTPNPAGCMSTSCPAGKKCVVTSECLSSGCAFDSASKTWACTPDCGGGRCEADVSDASADASGDADASGTTCAGVPNPAGCMSTGCPAGKTCFVGSQCFSSGCDCISGSWVCLPDCSGGECTL